MTRAATPRGAVADGSWFPWSGQGPSRAVAEVRRHTDISNFYAQYRVRCYVDYHWWREVLC